MRKNIRRAAVIGLAALVIVMGFGSPRVQGASPPNYTAFAFETITVSSTALPFTQATAFPSGEQGASMAVVTIAGDSIRHREDGLVPTASVGHLEPAGTQLRVDGQAVLKSYRMIRVTTDSTVSVTYYREGP